MQRKLTITVDPEVYEGLHRVIGRGHISHFIESLVRPHVTLCDLEEQYRLAAQDEEAEREANEWSEGLIGDVADEPW